MEDELDVDIEGDEFDSNVSDLDGGGLNIPENFIQSAWKGSAGILPWELDSSISAENKEVIERMLLEEQYYLTGQEIPKHIWSHDANNKPQEKKSPAKASASSSSSRWSKQEKELFEQGLAQFGRRWTKISKLVGGRTVLQVKSYARQYFKHKAKSQTAFAAPSIGSSLQVYPSEPASSHVSTLVNTVRIERLSEDEDVDITDDFSDDGKANDKQLDQTQKNSPKEEPRRSPADTEDHARKESPGIPSASLFSCSKEPGVIELNEKDALLPDLSKGTLAAEGTDSKSVNDNHEGKTSREGETGNNGAEYSDKEATDAEEEEDEDEEELKVPEQEIEMDMETITEDEKQAIPEFFEGRPSKTPERYLKIRNYILDQWLKSKPKYLNKTSVRPGLKNCGDVNCIGRIHTYLELIGAINFSCEQAVYNRPRVVDRSRQKDGKEVLEAYQLAQRLQSMRTRKRRVRDTWGNWCDPKDLEGQTYEHLSVEELAMERRGMKKQPKPCKMPRLKGTFDPFQLIPCWSFGEDVQEPFQVVVCAETLLIMDMHAHVSRGEVIGLLGGSFNEKEKVLKVCVAEPCNSVSTGLQCEMDPVSQTQACDILSSLGFSVVGWYHSHPSFHPNPSVRDINTQDQFQSYFSRGGAPFIGMIVSPYDPANPSPHSQTTCLLVKESQEASESKKLPYKFDFLPSQDIPDWGQTLRRALWIIHKYSQTPGSVQMDRFFRRDSHLTCLEKMLSSLARYLEPLPEDEGDSFLNQINALFQSDFIAKQQSYDQDEGEPLNISLKPIDSGDLGRGDSDQENAADICTQATPQTPTPETNHLTVLHMGSVLSTEHDYLL